MTSLTGFAEDYVKHALKQQSSSDKKEQKRLKKIMDKSRKDYIDNYIIGRDLPFKRGIMGYDKRSKASLKKAEQAFDRHMQSVVTQINEETDRKNKLRRQQLEKRKAEEKAIQERINNECTKIQTKEECVNEQNINNCYWNVNLKKNQHGDTLWKNTCQKITKRSIQIGKRKIQKPKLSSLGSISEEGGESKELSTNALTVEQPRLLNLEALNPGKDMSAGKRKRKTRKRRKRRRTKKKRLRKRRRTRKKRKRRR